MKTLISPDKVCPIAGWEDDGGHIPEVSYTIGGRMWRMVATEEEIAAYEEETRAKTTAESAEEEDVVNPSVKDRKGQKATGLKDLSWQQSFLAGASILAMGGMLVAFLYLVGVILSGAIALLQSF